MKKTIQWKQTYLLAYLLGWNRLQIILVLCWNRTDVCFWNALPATCFSRKSTQEKTTDSGETQTSSGHSFGEVAAEVRTDHDPGWGGLPVSTALGPLSQHSQWATSILKGQQFLYQCHFLPPKPNGHEQYKPTPLSYFMQLIYDIVLISAA